MKFPSASSVVVKILEVSEMWVLGLCEFSIVLVGNERLFHSSLREMCVVNGMVDWALYGLGVAVGLLL